MGHITGPFGVMGWVKIHPYTETSKGLSVYPSLWLGKHGEFVEHKVTEAKPHVAEVVAKFEGYDDREAAVSLKGMEVAVPRSALPKAKRDEYYWTDLIGLTVVNTEGANLGTVKNLLQTGANDVLVVQEGETERLLPFIRQVILDVDLAGKKITVDWGVDY